MTGVAQAANPGWQIIERNAARGRLSLTIRNAGIRKNRKLSKTMLSIRPSETAPDIVWNLHPGSERTASAIRTIAGRASASPSPIAMTKIMASAKPNGRNEGRSISVPAVSCKGRFSHAFPRAWQFSTLIQTFHVPVAFRARLSVPTIDEPFLNQSILKSLKTTTTLPLTGTPAADTLTSSLLISTPFFFSRPFVGGSAVCRPSSPVLQAFLQLRIISSIPIH